MASDLVTPAAAAQASIAVRKGGGGLNAIMGLMPVGVGPLFLCLTGFDLAITVLYTERRAKGRLQPSRGSNRNPDT